MFNCLLLWLWRIIDDNENRLLISKLRVRLHSMELNRNFLEISIMYSLSCKFVNAYVLAEHLYSFPLPLLRDIRRSSKVQVAVFILKKDFSMNKE